jgi:hypothetical protein
MGISRTQRFSLILEANIPNSLLWYDVGGQIIFPFYAASGAVTSKAMAFLIKTMPIGPADMGMTGLQEHSGGRWFSLIIEDHDGDAELIGKIQEAVKALNGNDAR